MDDIKTLTSHQEEQDGLTITYDEVKGEITFDWNAITHPQYNYLEEVPEEQLLQHFLDRLSETLEHLQESEATAV